MPQNIPKASASGRWKLHNDSGGDASRTFVTAVYQLIQIE